MKIRIEIDPFTKSGRKAYEFIENLKDKKGITYLTEREVLSSEEIKELEKEAIKIFDEVRNELSQENEEISTNRRTKTMYKRHSKVAGR